MILFSGWLEPVPPPHGSPLTTHCGRSPLNLKIKLFYWWRADRMGRAERSRICSDLCCGGRGLADHHGITASLIHANLWISPGQGQVQAARCVYFKLVSPCYECFVLELGCCGCVQMLLSRPSNNTNTRHGRSADLITDTLVTNISAILPGVSLCADIQQVDGLGVCVL